MTGFPTNLHGMSLLSIRKNLSERIRVIVFEHSVLSRPRSTYCKKVDLYKSPAIDTMQEARLRSEGKHVLARVLE